MRFRLVLALGVSLICAMLPTTSSATPQNPETFVRQFYEWYIGADKSATPAENSPGMYRFVAKGTADRIREEIRRGSLPDNVAYFTKVQDYDPAEWLSSMDIHRALWLNNGVSVVAVSFGKKTKLILCFSFISQKTA